MASYALARKKGLLLLASITVVAAFACVYFLEEKPLPTLIFSDIGWEPEIISAGRPVVFKLKLAYRGFLPRLVTVRAFAARYYDYLGFGKFKLFHEVRVSVFPGRESTVEIKWIPPEAGFYRLRFEVDEGSYLNQLIRVSGSKEVKKAFVFAVLGDNRPASKDMPQPAVFKELVREINLIHPDFVIIVGDVIYGGERDLAKLKGQWADFLAVYNRFEIPVFIAPGNHEMQTLSRPKSGNPDAQILYMMYFGRLFYAFAYGNSLFIVLDTDVVGSAAEISGKQLEWLKRILDLSKNYTHTFVFMHRPIVSYAGASLLNNYYKVLPLLLQYNVTAVFQGHNHAYYFREVNGTLFYVTGGAGAPLHRMPDEGGVHHFLLVEVNGSRVEVKFIPPYVLQVKNESNRVIIEYTFTERIIFKDDGYTWFAEPKPLMLRGICVETSTPCAAVEGGLVTAVVRGDHNYKVYVKTYIKPGEKKILTPRKAKP